MDRLTKINKYGTVEPYIRLSSQSEADDWHNDCVKQLAHYEDLAEQGRLVDVETYQKRLIRYVDAGKYRSADKKVFSENDVIYLIEHGVFQCEAEQSTERLAYWQKG